MCLFTKKYKSTIFFNSEASVNQRDLLSSHQGDDILLDIVIVNVTSWRMPSQTIRVSMVTRYTQLGRVTFKPELLFTSGSVSGD